MTELAFLKILMLIKQVHQKVQYFSLLAFLDKEFKFQSDVCNGCHGVLLVSMNLINIVFLNICGVEYR